MVVERHRPLCFTGCVLPCKAFMSFGVDCLIQQFICVHFKVERETLPGDRSTGAATSPSPRARHFCKNWMTGASSRRRKMSDVTLLNRGCQLRMVLYLHGCSQKKTTKQDPVLTTAAPGTNKTLQLTPTTQHSPLRQASVKLPSNFPSTFVQFFSFRQA